MNIALRKKKTSRDLDVDIGDAARARGQSFSLSITEMAATGAIDPRGHWARAAKERMKKTLGVTRELKRGQYLSSLDKKLSGLDASKLPAHLRGRMAAVKKHAKQMQELSKTGALTADAEKRGVGKAAASAFGILGGDKQAKGLFDLAAQSNDHLTRDEMRKSFGKRGLVTDVAAERGMPWDQAAKGLGSLGLIGKNDPRLAVTDKQISTKAKQSDLMFDDSEVNTGTAATSIMQLGRSMDEASASIGNRLNGAYKGLGSERPKGPAQKSAHHQERAALSEATGMASLRAGGSKRTAMELFAFSGANVRKSQEAQLSMVTKKMKKDLSR